ncbi:MAG TPA: hypothetical protein PKH77_16265, partial [Anaerolineae bacterium]|nr:hypothetical protein [Anaerolineae bacterium]
CHLWPDVDGAGGRALAGSAASLNHTQVLSADGYDVRESTAAVTPGRRRFYALREKLSNYSRFQKNVGSTPARQATLVIALP